MFETYLDLYTCSFYIANYMYKQNSYDKWRHKNLALPQPM